MTFTVKTGRVILPQHKYEISELRMYGYGDASKVAALAEKIPLIFGEKALISGIKFSAPKYDKSELQIFPKWNRETAEVFVQIREIGSALPDQELNQKPDAQHALFCYDDFILPLYFSSR
jgi:hypothetical protein